MPNCPLTGERRLLAQYLKSLCALRYRTTHSTIHRQHLWTGHCFSLTRTQLQTLLEISQNPCIVLDLVLQSFCSRCALVHKPLNSLPRCRSTKAICSKEIDPRHWVYLSFWCLGLLLNFRYFDQVLYLCARSVRK